MWSRGEPGSTTTGWRDTRWPMLWLRTDNRQSVLVDIERNVVEGLEVSVIETAPFARTLTTDGWAAGCSVRTRTAIAGNWRDILAAAPEAKLVLMFV